MRVDLPAARREYQRAVDAMKHTYPAGSCTACRIERSVRHLVLANRQEAVRLSKSRRKA